MSRRTPIKELIAEDAGTPSSPIRRSTRIATRRPSVQDEGGTPNVDESDRVSISSTSSMGSRSGRKLRALSKSPPPLNNEDITKVPAKRTRKGSTSSLIEEELLSSNRGGSPAPGRITRRSLARSLSVSPTSELESRNRKTSTPKKSALESATSKGGVIKKSRRLSVSDTVSPLESIKELSPQKENVNKNSIETTDEKDLPVKKKKSALLQTITEKSFTDDLETNKTGNNISVHDDESVKNVKDTTKSPKETEKSPNQKEKLPEKTKKSPREKEKLSKETENSPNEKEKSLKETVKSPNQNDKSPNETQNALNKVDLNIKHSKNIIPSLSLKRRLNSNSSTEEKELIVVLNSINKHDDSLNRSEDLNCSSSKENSYLKQQADKLNSEDENLSLHISESEDSEEKDKNSLFNESCSSNKSMKTNVEEKIVPQTADVAPRDTESTVEINVENIQEAKNSFCEPMDVDVTVLETSSPKLNLNDEQTTSTDINVSKDLNQSDSEKLEHTDVNDKVDNISKNACNTSTGSILNTSSKSDRSNRSAKEFKSPQKHKQITDNEDSPKNDSAAQDINTTQSDEVHLSLPETETTETSFSSPKISSKADVDQHGETSPQFSSPSNDNITISPAEELNTKQYESLGQSNVSINEENNKIIVATNLTPVRRSPRLQISSDLKTKTLSNESVVSEDVLKINTPPDSVKSANSSVDELELSANEHKDAAETTFDISKNINGDVEKIKDKSTSDVENDQNEGETEKNVNASQKNDLENKSKNNVSFSSEPELNATLHKKITELTETLEVDSSDESVTKYIDNMAEEGEEDTPSEGSNDIIDLGESIGSTESEIDSDESYELDSFIDDDDDVQLLSGEEYDLNQTKPKPKPPKKRRKIIQINDSSDDEEDKGNKVEIEKNHVSQQNGTKNKHEEDSDVEKMSTQPYCGLTPPSIVSVRDSPSEEEIKTFNNKDDEESVTSVVINKEDNLKSLEQIKDHTKDPDKHLNSSLKKKTPTKITPLKVTLDKTPTVEKKTSCVTPNNSILETSTSRAESTEHRKRLSSLTIHETVNMKDISDGSVSERILKVVEVFCSSVSKSGDSNSGNISLNVSLDYISTSPDKPNIREEHKEVIALEPLHQSFKTESNTDTSGSSKSAKRKKSLEMKKSSPLKIVFTKASTSDEQNVSNDEDHQLITKSTRRLKRLKRNATQEAPVASGEESGLKKDKKKKAKYMEVDLNTTEGDTEEQPKALKRQNKKSRKTAKKLVVNNESDSDMSPDLDKELNEKYNNSSEIENEDSSSAAECPKINVKETEVGESKTNKKRITKKSVNAYESADEDDSHSTTKKLLNKKKPDGISSVQARREKRMKRQNDSNENGWQVEYLPKEIKVALSLGRSKKNSEAAATQKEKPEKTIKNKPKLVPSLNSRKRSWGSDQMNTLLKPSTSSDINQIKELDSVNVDSFHKKDFKNRTLFDSKRVKRMGTKELLKTKGKM